MATMTLLEAVRKFITEDPREPSGACNYYSCNDFRKQPYAPKSFRRGSFSNACREVLITLGKAREYKRRHGPKEGPSMLSKVVEYSRRSQLSGAACSYEGFRASADWDIRISRSTYNKYIHIARRIPAPVQLSLGVESTAPAGVPAKEPVKAIEPVKAKEPVKAREPVKAKVPARQAYPSGIYQTVAFLEHGRDLGDLVRDLVGHINDKTGTSLEVVEMLKGVEVRLTIKGASR